MKISTQKHVIPAVLSALVIIGSILVTIYPPQIIRFFEEKTYDWRFLLRGARPTSTEVVIVAVDERSISRLGRWPWSRATTADLVDAISAAGPRVIGMDIIFSEAEKGEGLKVIEEIRRDLHERREGEGPLFKKLASIERTLDADRRLAQALARAGNVVLPLAFRVPRHTEALGEGAEPVYIRGSQYLYVKEGGFFLPYVARQVLPPLEPLAGASAAMGHIYTTYDADGTIRWEPLSVKFKDSYYPSFGLEIARVYLGVQKDEVSLFTGEGVGFLDEFIETDEAGRILINYAGPSGTIPAYSAVDLMEGRVEKTALEGKAVLLGTTAIGTYDIHVTPYANMAGVEKQAAVVDGIIRSDYIVRAESQWLTVAAFIVFYGVLLGVALQRVGAFTGGLLAISLFLTYLAFAYYVFAYKGVWIDFIAPSMTIFFSYAALTGYRYMTEERRAREIKSIFSSYVTKKVVDALVKNPEMARLGGERKEITVLFSDIRGFTTFSERHQPEEVVKILNEYLTSMTDVVFRWEGTLDKFVGDAVMVFWNAPAAQENHAVLAIKCALDMMGKLKKLQEKWRVEGQDPFDIGIGINTGEVIVGNMGAEGKKMDYTVIGDHVNLGARVEGLTRHYDSHIIMTEFTYAAVSQYLKDNVIWHVGIRELDSVKVKGKDLPVVIYGIESLEEGRRSEVLAKETKDPESL